MKRCDVFALVLAAIIVLWTCPDCGGQDAQRLDDVKAVADSSNALGLDLYGKLRASQENLFFSPYSIASALSMLHAGARGVTAAEMAKCLHVSLPPQRQHAAFAELNQQLISPDQEQNYTLTVVNQLWGRSGAEFLDAYLSLTRRAFGANLRELDFQRNPESARMQINDWVQEQSRGKIEDLLARGAVNKDTRLVLTNVIYFLGNWASPFDSEETAEGDFHVSNSRIVRVPMMHKEGMFGLRTNHGVQALTISYRGFRLSMVVLLPERIGGLKSVEETLSDDSLASWHSTETRQMEVYLPRFKIESQFDLKDPLKRLGMELVFSDDADFSGMNGEGNLSVTSAVHKAVIGVDETGTEAAAATGISVGATAAAVAPKVFRADHPFLFLIRDDDTGCILFMGRVLEP